ncbi:hypothetical protein EW145_g4608 [Phellinidium pouzarii]|uniref:Ricin B lectin domain-containing protein n=1 Tax=Phellinidium pouzarii TaxID=167371 RepID=A0A4V3XCF5_9AGAM|nr:hypothetical protein EW145_g4608 [Phellinidium pouzarii]
MIGTVMGVNESDNALVGQDRYSDSQGLIDYSQMWFLEILPNHSNTCFLIRDAMSKLVLDVTDNRPGNNASIFVCPISGNDNQHWKIELLINDSEELSCCRIVSVCTGTVLKQTDNIDQNVVPSTWNYEEQQQHWFLEPVVLPTVYRFMHAWTGSYLQYSAAEGITASKLQSSTSAIMAQLWTLESQEDIGTYVIRSVEDSTQVVDIFSSFTTDGTPVIAFPYHGGPNQRWRITNSDSSSPGNDGVKIISVLADTVIQVSGWPHFGKLQLQSNKNDISQTWRMLQSVAPARVVATVPSPTLKRKSPLSPVSELVFAASSKRHESISPAEIVDTLVLAPQSKDVSAGPEDRKSSPASTSASQKDKETLASSEQTPSVDDYEKGLVVCGNCGEGIPFRDPQSGGFTLRLWDLHRDKCRSQKDSQPEPIIFAPETTVDTMVNPPLKKRRAKRTEEERIEYLRTDPYVAQFEAYRVLCGSCNKWIRLRPNSTYCSIPWDAHRKSCLSKKA